ncbi:hypothetical protein GCM10009835_21230 [Planosporangium flavigriseum]|uniref:Uncharacterized protein n=1 Tax=Planosporangium flavigriseum TaxID=373681 RepID=A0A8J3PLK4_9ACTN|nr:hypothetical protein Pfl04_23110 [Planosporangium flavigriseum]
MVTRCRGPPENVDVRGREERQVSGEHRNERGVTAATLSGARVQGRQPRGESRDRPTAGRLLPHLANIRR